jgi:linoleoyl-CoA desaturase
MQAIKFPASNREFFSTLNQRVNQYFQGNNLSRHANANMVVKTMFMFTLYLVPYFLVITGSVTQPWPLLAMCVLMGLGTAGIGLSVMHDANHGAYSSRPWVNSLLGYSLNLVGGFSFNWKVQHNVLHHTYTNIEGVDEDITPRGVLRFSPYSPWKPYHRFQWFYAWFLYGLLTFVWVVAKDFTRLFRYGKDGMVEKQKSTVAREWLRLIFSKVLYVGYFIVLPTLLLPLSIWQVLLGFLIVHYISGFILAIIFQPAHVIDGTSYPMPDESGEMENNWAIHQLHTTTNFAHRNRILSWYVGGLNYQVEHHLFPTICHIHYRNIAPIVKQTAEEFGLPYKSAPTFRSALVGHVRLLKKLGEKDFVPQVAMA